MEQNAVVFSNKRYLYVRFILMLPVTLGVGLVLSIPIDRELRLAGLDFCDWPLLLCWLGPIVYLVTFFEYVYIDDSSVNVVGPFRPSAWDKRLGNTSIHRVYYQRGSKLDSIVVEYIKTGRVRKFGFDCGSPRAIVDILDHFKAVGIRTGVRGDFDPYGLRGKYLAFKD